MNNKTLSVVLLSAMVVLLAGNVAAGSAGWALGLLGLSVAATGAYVVLAWGSGEHAESS